MIINIYNYKYNNTFKGKNSFPFILLLTIWGGSLLNHKLNSKIRKKKIVLFIGSSLSQIGGVKKVIQELAELFISFGYHVEIVSPYIKTEPQYTLKGGIILQKIPCWGSLQGEFPIPKIGISLIKIFFRYSRNDCNIFITNTRFYPFTLLGWILSRLYKIPIIHLEHGSNHIISNKKFIESFGKVFDHTIGTLIVKCPTTNVGVSIAAKKFIEHLGGEQVEVIHNGLDLSKFDNAVPIEAIKKQNRIVLIFIGRLVYLKGIQDLIEIIPELPDNVILYIVGDGPYRDYLERLATEIPDEKIKFIGEQPYEKVPSLLKSADIAINPSYSEGLPTTVIEACAAGCAVIATDVGGTREIIEDGRTGFLIPAANLEILKAKIELLSKNEDLRKKMGQAARLSIENNYSFELMQQQWISLVNNFN